MAETRRKDSHGRVLKHGESERKQGGYQFRWTTVNGSRKCIYAKTLSALRDKEKHINTDLPATSYQMTVNDLYEKWIVHKNVRNTTLSSYKKSYTSYVKPYIGSRKIIDVKQSDIGALYDRINKSGIAYGTIRIAHTVLKQMFDTAVDDDILIKNPCTRALRYIPHDTTKRKALTIEQEQAFLDYIRSTAMYAYLYPLYFLLCSTGLRIGEALALQMDDVNFNDNTITISKTLVLAHNGKKKRCLEIHNPKTKSGERIIPMTNDLHEVLLGALERREIIGTDNIQTIDGYKDFFFINNLGRIMTEQCLNEQLHNLIDRYNADDSHSVKLPHFGCHTLRHTFCTRLCESGVNIKAIQSIMGHSDIQTTMNIYTDATQQLKTKEMSVYENYMHSVVHQ